MDGAFMDSALMDSALTDDDLGLLLAEVQRFRRKSVQPLVARPERTIDAAQLASLTRRATEFGLLNPGPETGSGIWEDTGGSGWIRFSSAALRTVAQASAGVAFHFHQLALGDYVRRRLGLVCGPPSIVCLQGTFGLARYSLARLLKSKPLDEDDRAVLKDYFFTPSASEPKPLLFQAAEDWQQLLVPCLDEHCQLSWFAFARADLDLQALPHSHGLNEMLVQLWQPGDTPPRRVPVEHDPAGHDAALATYMAAFQLNALALIAIAWGAVQQGYDKAREYAALRRQGGAAIQQHAAVRLMLARAAGVLRTVGLLCDQLARLPVARDSLGTVVAVRAETHDLLCAAANESLQTLGGAGYTCEAGLEKIVRDGNHLRLLCGTPDELRMFLSEWENGA